MFGKLITLFVLLVTANAFSIRSADDEEAVRKNPIDYRLPTNVVPIHYNLKIESNIALGDFNFTGETATEIEILQPTNEIILHCKSLTLDEAQTRLVNKNGESQTPKEHHYDDEREMLTLVFPDTLPAGIYTLHLQFSGELATNLRGFYRSSYKNENGDITWLAVTHFQPITARQAFPCWDEPALKATFNVSVKHHANYTALSNMPAFEQTPMDEGDSDGKVWTHFEKTPIMSTHIVAFIICDFVSVPMSNGKARLWVRKSILPDVQYFIDAAQKIGDEMENYMNTSLPVPKMDHVAVPQYSSRATENWGLIVYLEDAVVYNPNKTMMFDGDRVAMLAAHELSHQWISNMVGPRWWNYLWMSEGFAAYYDHYIVSKVFPNLRLMDLFPLQILQEVAFRVDWCPRTNPMNRNVSSPGEIYSVYSHITYRKASSVLRMLSHCVSDEVFRVGLLKYLHEHQFNTALPDDLWRSMQNALDESSVPHKEFNVKDVMDTWIQQSGYPTVFVSRDNDTGAVQVHQAGTISELDTDGEECNTTWWIPLNFATQENPDFTSTLPTHWLSPTKDVKTIEGLPSDGWIIANIQQTGYYRVQYDLENWEKLLQYLNSDNYKNIHVLNRAQVLNDAFSAAMSKSLPYEVFGRLVRYLERETDPLPWLVAYYWSIELDFILLFPQSGDIYKSFLWSLLRNKLQNPVDYMDQPEDERSTKIFKFVIKNLACLSDAPECYGNATAQLDKYLENPDSIFISTDSQKWVFCNGLRRANQSTWDNFLDLYTKKQETSYLNYLTCTENKNVLENLLNMTLFDDSPLQVEDIADVYYGIVRQGREAGIDALIDFITKHWTELESKTERRDGVFNYLSHRITTKQQLSKMIAHHATISESPDGMIEHFEMRRNYIDEVAEHLKELVKTTRSNNYVARLG